MKFFKSSFMNKHFCLSTKVGKNKAFEFEGGVHEEWSWFEFIFKLTRHCDHAGLFFNIEILGAWLSFNFCDSRHWNYDQNRYYFHGEESSGYDEDFN